MALVQYLRGNRLALIVVSSLLQVVAGLFIGMRLWIRRRRHNNKNGSPGSMKEDAALMASWLLQGFFVIIISISAVDGFGGGRADSPGISPHELEVAGWSRLVGFGATSLALGMSQVAVVLFLLRLIGKNTRVWHRITLRVIMVVVMAIHLATSITIFFRCMPVNTFWGSELRTTATCPRMIIFIRLAYAQCAVSTATNFFLALFPWYILRDVKLASKDKKTTCVSLSLGLLAGICSIVEAITLRHIEASGHGLDEVARFYIWQCIEQAVILVAVSMPVLRPLWSPFPTHHHHQPLASSSSSSGSTWPYFGRKPKLKAPEPTIDEEELGLKHPPPTLHVGSIMDLRKISTSDVVDFKRSIPIAASPTRVGPVHVVYPMQAVVWDGTCRWEDFQQMQNEDNGSYNDGFLGTSDKKSAISRSSSRKTSSSSTITAGGRGRSFERPSRDGSDGGSGIHCTHEISVVSVPGSAVEPGDGDGASSVWTDIQSASS